MNKKLVIGALFILLLLMVSGSNYSRLLYLIQRQTSLSSGIYGYVTESPTCPGPARLNSICKKPFKTQLVIKNFDGTQEIAHISSDDMGYFKVALPPGNYLIEGSSTLPPYLNPTNVTVQNNTFTKVQLDFNTGIR